MPTRFKPFPPLSCRYGAPMGRASDKLDTGLPFDAYGVAGPAGEYDSGGAYWGLGGSQGPVWAVWVKGKGREGVAYVRATGRAGAVMAALFDADDITTEVQPNGRIRAAFGKPADSDFETGHGGTRAEAWQDLYSKLLAKGVI